MTSSRIVPGGLVREAAKIAFVTAWLAFATYFFQSHFESRAVVAQETGWRTRTEDVLSHFAPAGSIAQVVNGDSRMVIEGGGSALETADRIDHAVRHFGLDHVIVGAGDRQALYWIVFELFRRGYEEDEILSLLGRPGRAPAGC